MRTAQICPTCATYTNAVCVIYDGPYLDNIQLAPMTNLEDAFGLVNIAISAIGLPQVLATNDTALSNDIFVNGVEANVFNLVNNTSTFTTEVTAPNASAQRNIQFPNNNGVVALSVNGNTPDSAGNISLGGYTGSITVGLQTLNFTNGVLISVV